MIYTSYASTENNDHLDLSYWRRNTCNVSFLRKCSVKELARVFNKNIFLQTAYDMIWRWYWIFNERTWFVSRYHYIRWMKDPAYASHDPRVEISCSSKKRNFRQCHFNRMDDPENYLLVRIGLLFSHSALRCFVDNAWEKWRDVQV